MDGKVIIILITRKNKPAMHECFQILNFVEYTKIGRSGNERSHNVIVRYMMIIIIILIHNNDDINYIYIDKISYRLQIPVHCIGVFFPRLSTFSFV